VAGSLDGRIAIVTGAARGIGAAYAKGLATEGASVVVADVLDGSAVVDDIARAGGAAIAVEADVRDPGSTEAMAAAADERFGGIDVLVNNAAFFKQARRGPFEEIEVDEWDRAFEVNVRGAWLCARAVYPSMRRRGGGSIINISSNTPFKGVPGFLHYTASKSAIIGLTRALAREVGDDGIAVNTVAPDFIPDEEMATTRGAEAEMIVRQRCFKRTQTPEDMVGVVVFLAGPGAAFITGQSILVNGGALFQ
jgi:3-oxoacyl-[acyl-carrier protein] reductase